MWVPLGSSIEESVATAAVADQPNVDESLGETLCGAQVRQVVAPFQGDYDTTLAADTFQTLALEKSSKVVPNTCPKSS